MLNHSRASDLHTELERRIVRGLSCEWDLAAAFQEHYTGTAMRMPLFALRDMKKLLGTWSPQKREIALSRHFVFHHPWDAAREVLLHEMAHQLADEVLKSGNEPPHGPTFQRACHILRANPEASGSYTPLDQRVAQEDREDGHKMVIKIRKLLALSESSNRHEAEAAMKKAHEMIGRYNVDLLKLQEKRQFFTVFLGKPALRHFRETYHLAQLIQDFYFVQAIWVSAFVLEKEKMGRVLEISGTRQNIRIAAYVHDYILHYIDHRWERYCIKKGKYLNRYRKTDFAVGVIDGFYAKLSEASSGEVRERHQEQALTQWGDPQLVRYFKHRYPHTQSRRHAARACDVNIISDGIQYGRDLVISKGVTETRQTNKMLTHQE